MPKNALAGTIKRKTKCEDRFFSLLQTLNYQIVFKVIKNTFNYKITKSNEKSYSFKLFFTVIKFLPDSGELKAYI